MKTSFSLVLVVLVSSCSPVTDPELTCDASTASVTLAGEVHAQLFVSKCVSCHEAGYTYGDYTTPLTTGTSTKGIKSLYAGMPGLLKIVEPGQLANSSMWLKVLGGASKGRTGPRGENVFGKMPNDGTELTSAQKQLLKDWICSGAN